MLIWLKNVAELKAEEDKIQNYKHLIQVIFKVKVILKIMALKIIQFFRQYKDILKRLVILNIFQHGNLMDCLMKALSLLLHLIIVFLQD